MIGDGESLSSYKKPGDLYSEKNVFKAVVFVQEDPDLMDSACGGRERHGAALSAFRSCRWGDVCRVEAS